MAPYIDEALSRIERDLDAELLSYVQPENRSAAREVLKKKAELHDHRITVSTRSSAHSQRFVEMGKAIDAVVEYLREEDRPLTKEEICNGVLAGGWKGGGPELYSWVSRSLELFLNPDAMGARGKVVPIKRIGGKDGKIGLKTWEDERWQ